MSFIMNFSFAEQLEKLKKEFNYLKDHRIGFLVKLHISSELKQRIYPNTNINEYMSGLNYNPFDSYSFVFFEEDFKKIKSRITEVFSDFIENIIKIMYVDIILKKGHRISCRVNESTFIYTVDEEQRVEKMLEFDITNNIQQYFKLLEKNNIFLSGKAKLNTIVEYFEKRCAGTGFYEPNEYDYKNCENLLFGYDTKASKTQTLFEALYGCLDKSFSSIELPKIDDSPQFTIIQYNTDEPKYILYLSIYNQS